MRLPRLWPSLPLLAKELVEQAARRRTYVVRVLYVAGLTLGFFLALNKAMRYRSDHPLALLGAGRELFEALLVMQFVGIYLFLPGTMSGVLTVEKERGSLGLLLLTDLRPWEILLQKYLGRLVPMATMLLASLPLMAIAYGLGGISDDFFWAGILGLILACLQSGAIGLFFSSWCRTTPGAFLATYVLGGALLLLLPVLDKLGAIRIASESTVFVMLPPYISLGIGPAKPLWYATCSSMPILLSIAVFLALAHIVFLRRAFAPNRRLLARSFRALDRLMQRLNRLTGHALVLPEKADLPGDRPVAWREISKNALGRTHYLLRIFMLLWAPAFVIAVRSLGSGDGRGGPWQLEAMIALLWMLAALVLAVMGANTIAQERNHQTLDVLLTTPISGQEIVLEKVQGLRRLRWVAWPVFLTIMLAKAWWCSTAPDWRWQRHPESLAIYLAASILSLAIYLPLACWFGVWIGMRVRSRQRAILAAVIGMAGWVILPFMAAVIAAEAMMIIPDLTARYLALLSPAMIIAVNESRGLPDFYSSAEPWPIILANFLFYGVVLWWLRWRCLSRADRCLGRA